MKNAYNAKPNPSLRLQSRTGIIVELDSAGAALTAVYAPDRNGVFKNIALSCTDPSVFAGAIIAPVGGRICGGHVAIHNRMYAMPCNDGGNCLHSGPDTLGHAIWDRCHTDDRHVEFKMHLADGACGLPGNRVFTVTYTLAENTLCIEFYIDTDADTFVNPTSHAYWNLSGDFSHPAYEHVLTIHSQEVWYNDPQHLPLYRTSVQNTAFDFRTPRTLLQAMEQNPHDVCNARGYNNTFLLNGTPAAVLKDPNSGRQLVLETDAPYLVFYSGGYLDGVPLTCGNTAMAGCALAFEPQFVPDAPRLLGRNLPLLHAGETFHRVIRYRFGAI